MTDETGLDDCRHEDGTADDRLPRGRKPGGAMAAAVGMGLLLAGWAVLATCGGAPRDGQGMAAAEDEGRREPTVVALLVIRDDRIAGDTLFEVLPFALHEEGEYRAIEGYEAPARVEEWLPGDSILRAHPRYVVLSRGERIGSLMVDTIVQQHFDCSELFVGTGEAPFGVPVMLQVMRPDAAVVSGWSGGERIEYGITMLLALNEGAPAVSTQDRSVPAADALTAGHRSLLNDEAARTLAAQAGQEPGSAIGIRNLVSYDFDADGTAEHLVVAGRQGEQRWHSVVLAGRFEEGEWVPLLAEGRSESPAAWGDGYRLLDVGDLDGDAVPEVVFEVGGYEATSIEIFRFTGDAFERVFADVLFGC